MPAQGRRGRAWARGLWGWTCRRGGQAAAPSELLGGVHWAGQTSLQTAAFRAWWPCGQHPRVLRASTHCPRTGWGPRQRAPQVPPLLWESGTGPACPGPRSQATTCVVGDLCPRGQTPSLSPFLRGGSHCPHGIWLWAGGQAVMEAPLGEAGAHQAFLGGSSEHPPAPTPASRRAWQRWSHLPVSRCPSQPGPQGMGLLSEGFFPGSEWILLGFCVSVRWQGGLGHQVPSSRRVGSTLSVSPAA